MLSDRAKALRPEIQSAFDAGGLDAVCELFAQLVARVEELEKRLNIEQLQQQQAALQRRLEAQNQNA